MDIEYIFGRDFASAEQLEIKERINHIYSNEWGVGKEQLIRSLLQLAKGSLQKFNSFFPIIDPRDIIMEASMEDSSIRGDYFE